MYTREGSPFGVRSPSSRMMSGSVRGNVVNPFVVRRDQTNFRASDHRLSRSTSRRRASRRLRRDGSTAAGARRSRRAANALADSKFDFAGACWSGPGEELIGNLFRRGVPELIAFDFAGACWSGPRKRVFFRPFRLRSVSFAAVPAGSNKELIGRQGLACFTNVPAERIAACGAGRESH